MLSYEWKSKNRYYVILVAYLQQKADVITSDSEAIAQIIQAAVRRSSHKSTTFAIATVKTVSIEVFLI